MTQEHPITPPPELVEQWLAQRADYEKGFNELLIEAAQWGADQELEACLNWLTDRERFPVGHEAIEELKADRRPKQPSLKEINLKHLDVMERDGNYLPEILQDLRRAVEQLND